MIYANILIWNIINKDCTIDFDIEGNQKAHFILHRNVKEI